MTGLVHEPEEPQPKKPSRQRSSSEGSVESNTHLSGQNEDQRRTRVSLSTVPTGEIPSEHIGSSSPKQPRTRQMHAIAALPRPSTDTAFSDQSLHAAQLGDDLRNGHAAFHSPSPVGSPPPQQLPGRKVSWRYRIRRTWLASKGMLMVMIAQFFGASMNVMTRILELDGSHGKAMHPFEILFARQSVTVLCSALYMWYKEIPHPLGIREVRPLLLLRGVGGFFGVFGMYYSLLYLPLSEATVLTFLAPIASCYACSLLIPNETFTRKQQFAGLISLVGVVLIARPSSVLSSDPTTSPNYTETFNNNTTSSLTTHFFARRSESKNPEPDVGHHLLGIGAGLVGVVGATAAYTSIRWIGQRAHALVSVTYFSAFTTIVSLIAVLAIPSITFRLPNNIAEIALLVGLGTCGFILQFLLTAGLAYVPPKPEPSSDYLDPLGEGGGGEVEDEKSRSTHGSRATSMVYTQMLFALFYDKLVWDATPSAVSWTGSAIILCSALYVALARDESKKDTPALRHAADGAAGSGAAGVGGGASAGNGHRRKWSVSDERVVEEGRGLLQDYDDSAENEGVEREGSGAGEERESG